MKTKITLVIFLILVACSSYTHGQLPLFDANKPHEKFNPELIPSSASIVAALFPKRLSENPTFKYAPFEVVTTWGQTEFGFDPLLLQQITLIVKAPASIDNREEPSVAVILHFEKLQGLADNLIGQLQQKTIAGKTVYSAQHPYQPSYLIFDDATIIVGSESLFDSIVTSDGNSDLIRLTKQGTVHGQALAFVDVASIRGLLAELMNEAEKNFELPPPIIALREAPQLLQSIEVGTTAESQLETTLVLHAVDEQAAERLGEILVSAGLLIKQIFLSELAKQLDLSDPVQAATLQYANRIIEKYQTKLTPVIEDTDLTIVVHEEILAAPFLLGLLGTSSVNIFPEKVTPHDQLRTVAHAIHNYESAYGKFPPATINDKNGRPLLSGVVALLPFADKGIYQQLKLDERWDSAHNSKITSTIIPFLSDPTGQPGAGMVRFPVFKGGIWDEEKPATGFADLRDGSSNTILTIMAPDSAAINWADPTPWRISESNPMADIFGDRDKVVIGMADGSTQLLKKSEMTNDKLRAMLTIDGGEVPD